MLKIEKFSAGRRVQTIRVPAFALSVAGVLLPRAVQTALAARGIPLAAINEARRAGRSYRATFAVREHGVEKQIVVSTD